jgi:Zn-finger protein
MKAQKRTPNRIIKEEGLDNCFELYSDCTIIHNKQGLETSKWQLSELSNNDAEILNKGTYHEVYKLLVLAEISF